MRSGGFCTKPYQVEFCLLFPWLVRLLVLHKTSVLCACVSKILTDILFYVQDIPQSTRTISEYNLIKWCQWEHLLDRILKGLRVRGAGLKLFMVSINDLVCRLCIGCSLSLSNNGTKLCVVTDIFGLSYFLTGKQNTHTWVDFRRQLRYGGRERSTKKDTPTFRRQLRYGGRHKIGYTYISAPT